MLDCCDCSETLTACEKARASSNRSSHSNVWQTDKAAGTYLRLTQHRSVQHKAETLEAKHFGWLARFCSALLVSDLCLKASFAAHKAHSALVLARTRHIDDSEPNSEHSFEALWGQTPAPATLIQRNASVVQRSLTATRIAEGGTLRDSALAWTHAVEGVLAPDPGAELGHAGWTTNIPQIARRVETTAAGVGQGAQGPIWKECQVGVEDCRVRTWLRTSENQGWLARKRH